ncbi:MAG TPA: class I SAM-dependent methyltransferase [Candidatus Acidoferrum sp.]|jgi:SAM-dependent methyltransferase|nr:class I SAM-dependent methyltransferase [Candidatus Acidoferrum sp.]
MPDHPDYVLSNQAHWTQANAQYTDAGARASWASEIVTWGTFKAPEERVHALPDVTGKDVIELGCGTAYFAAWLKRRGARRVLGVDVTPAQLATAARLNEETGLGLELVEANAEHVPLPDATFDLAVSEYGASIWCDPKLWIPEAARLLREGGELVFLRNSTLSILCMPNEGQIQRELQRPQRGLNKLEWLDSAEVEFHPGHGDMFRLLTQSGLHLIDLIELYAAEDATDHEYYSYVPAEWARQWPAEEIWRARKG